jgi:hypothetical protein
MRTSVVVSILALTLLTSCASYSSVKATGELPPETVRVGSFVLGTYCENLTNLRRLTLRFIRALDPQWTSVCEEYEEAKVAALLEASSGE